MTDIIKQIQQNKTYASIPFWSWNDKLEEEELRRQIRNMKDLGMRGFFMHARSGLETEYMSKDWFDCARVCINETKKLGMEAWAYDENGWPSGCAGGELLKNPENAARIGLLPGHSPTVPKPLEMLPWEALPCYSLTGDSRISADSLPSTPTSLTSRNPPSSPNITLWGCVLSWFE